MKPTPSPPTGAPAQLGSRLIKLAAKGRDREHAEEDAFSWARAPKRPFWLPLQSYAGIIADLHFGELATAEACRRMATSLPEQEAKACLEVQHDDEQFHARLYARYLARLGVEGMVTSGLRDAYERCLSWPGDPLGLVLAFNVVLEGEAMRLQHHFTTRFPCPLFAQLNRRILTDEGRHIAFARIYGRPTLQRLDTEERIALFRHTIGLGGTSGGARSGKCELTGKRFVIGQAVACARDQVLVKLFRGVDPGHGRFEAGPIVLGD